MSKLKSQRFTMVAVLAWALIVNEANGQRAEFLSLDSEGTASVYTDSVGRIAYLLDGGRKGSLVRPRLDNKPVLAALLDRGIKHLVVTCSHPHDDHAGGLIEVIDSDANVARFDNITFVDSDYPEAESLYQRFLQRWPNYPPSKVRYESAKKRDAFAYFRSSGGDCKMSNFVYEPPNEPSHPHGQTVIATTDLTKAGTTTRVVDFDDASSALVAQWAEWAKANPAERRPDIIIAPHHSSDLTEISLLLDSAIRPKACVITANSSNRFVHPGPANWLKLVESLGVENVHVTATGNVVVTEKGLPALSKEARSAIRTQVIGPLIARVQKDRAISYEERLTADSKSVKRKIERAEERIKALEDLNVKYGGPAGDTPFLVAPSSSSIGPSSITGASGGPSGTNGTEAYRTLSQELSSKSGPTARQMRTNPTTTAHATRFRASRAGAPIFGGIIFGNSASPDSARPIHAQIILQKENDDEGGDRDVPVIHVVARQGGKEVEGYWRDAAPTELWAAYHMVHPKSEWKLPAGECGIVGKVGDGFWPWQFAIHPAVADTALALAAMQLDMFPAVVQEDENWRDIATLLPKDFDSYRWIDERARITIAKGEIQVVPDTGPDKCLLRLRFWQHPLSSDVKVNGQDAYELLSERIEKRRVAFKKAHGRPVSEDEEEKIVEEEAKKFGDQYGIEPKYDEAKFLTTVFGKFGPVQSMERFARAIAIMNWLSDSLGKDFPIWPANAKPITTPIIAELNPDQVLPSKHN
jgi:beta-lactamase superfamily II metal-dependent hydrolase